jgi:alpha-tubulin suppressor-like RCC1 family protein
VILHSGSGFDSVSDFDSDSCASLQLSQVSAGKGHTCALDEENWVHCWGDHEFSQSCPPELE